MRKISPKHKTPPDPWGGEKGVTGLEAANFSDPVQTARTTATSDMSHVGVTQSPGEGFRLASVLGRMTGRLAHGLMCSDVGALFQGTTVGKGKAVSTWMMGQRF